MYALLEKVVTTANEKIETIIHNENRFLNNINRFEINNRKTMFSLEIKNIRVRTIIIH